MRVAILHDMFPEFGGSERVVFEIASLFPTVDVFTLLYNDHHSMLRAFRQKYRVSTSWIDRLRPLVPLAKLQKLAEIAGTMYWESLDFSDYDLVVSSGYKYNSVAAIVPPTALHLAYIESTPKDLYHEQYYPMRRSQSRLKAFVNTLLYPSLRVQAFIGAQRPDVLIANSRYTQERIRKFCRRESLVLYPPISIPPTPLDPNGTRTYYLSFSRLDDTKGVELAIRATARMRKKLVIVGSGRREAYLRSLAPTHVTFMGFVKEERLSDVFSGAIANICCSLNEDFGMAAVEAMAHGVPVIAHGSGGFKETVVDGKTGVLYSDLSVEGVTEALARFEKLRIRPRDCWVQAKKFSSERFRKEFIQLINEEFRKKRVR